MTDAEVTPPRDSSEEHTLGNRRRWLPSLSVQILIGLFLGIAAGVVFGEWMAGLQLLGDIFVGLLQMTVLPYIVVSLVLSLGRLSYREVRLLAKEGGVFILLFWALAMIIVVAMVAGFPNWPSATFFSTSMIEEREPLNLVELYVPSNPFFSLSNGVIPAIVLASLAGGLALIGVPGKEHLLKSLETASEAIMRIAQFIVKLAPIGVFALVAATAGTISIEDIGRLQVYLFTYIGAALLLSLWVLPGLVSVLTPIPYKRVLTGTQDALITAFATYNLLIVLPLLAERIKEMLRETELLNSDTQSAADLIVPINFNLPNLGKLLALGFIPFAGWFAGAPLSLEQYPQFLTSGLFSFFGEVVVALPFLLDLMRIPADTFQVFLAVDQFSGRFGTLLAGMHTVVLGLLTAVAVSDRLQLNWPKLGRYALISLLLGVAVFGGLRLFFEYVVPQEYRQFRALQEIDLVTARPTTRVLDIEEVEPLPASAEQSRVEVIRDRGTLRVGYLQDALPYAYKRQGTDTLVGIEVDMVQMIANGLSVSLDLVETQRAEAAEHLNTGRIDMVIGGLTATPDRALAFQFSEAYMLGSISFIVRDHRRGDFGSWEAVHQINPLKLALPDAPFFERRVKWKFPDAQITIVDSPADFLTAPEGRFDAMMYSAEAGSAWTLLYPQFSVVIPKPGVASFPVVFGLPKEEADLKRYVDAWIDLKKSSGGIERLYEYWILGRGTQLKKRRWSVVHDLLGWGQEETQVAELDDHQDSRAEQGEAPGTDAGSEPEAELEGPMLPEQAKEPQSVAEPRKAVELF